ASWARQARLPDWQISSIRPPASATMRRRWAFTCSSGRFTAPSMCAVWNSAGVRTSTTSTSGLAAMRDRAETASIVVTCSSPFVFLCWAGGGAGGGEFGHAGAAEHDRAVALGGQQGGGDGRAAARGASDEHRPVPVQLGGDTLGQQVGQEPFDGPG